MNTQNLIDLVDRLRAHPSETEWLEFKHNKADPQEIGEYMSALANEASLCNQPRGYLVFGIDDRSHEVVGTSFDPYAMKAKGNQDLLPWLGSLLQPNPGIDVLLVDHPSGRVVMLAVGPTRDRPTLSQAKPTVGPVPARPSCHGTRRGSDHCGPGPLTGRPKYVMGRACPTSIQRRLPRPVCSLW